MSQKVGSLHVELTAETAKHKKGLTQAREELGRVSDEYKKFSSSLDAMVARHAQKTEQMAKQQKELADAAFKVSAVFAAASLATGGLLVSSTRLASQVETLGIVTTTLGKNVGMAEAQVRSLEKAIQSKGITLRASRQAIAQMIQAEIDLARATDLARLAQDAAVISGENSSEAFEALVTTIATGNVLMARRRGLLVDFQSAYQREAQALGKSVDALTEQEKVIARTNEIMRQGVNITGAYENSMTTAGKKASSLARHIEESRRALGEMWLPTYADAIDAITASLRKWQDLDQSQKDTASSALGYATAIAAANSATFGGIATYLKASQAIRELARSLQFASVSAMGLAAAKIALPVTLIAIATMGIYQANQKYKQSVEELTRAWNTSIDEQAAAALKADQIADSFLRNQRAMRAEIAKTQGIKTYFFGEQGLNESYGKLSESVLVTARSYEEYETELKKVARANGLVINSHGNLVRVYQDHFENTEELILANYLLSRSFFDVEQSVRGLLPALEDGRDKLAAYLDLMEMTAQRNFRLSIGDILTAVSGGMDKSAEAFSSSQLELELRLRSIKIAIQELNSLPFLTNEQKDHLYELRSEMFGIERQIGNNAAAHDDMTKRALFNLMIQRAELLNLSDASAIAFADMARDIAFAWGLVDETTYNSMRAFDKGLADAVSSGNWDDLRKQILSIGTAAANISGEYPITFVVRTIDMGTQMLGPAAPGQTMPTLEEWMKNQPGLPGVGGRSRGSSTFTPPSKPEEDKPRGGGGWGGARPETTLIEKLMGASHAAANLGAFAASIIERDTLEPARREIEEIKKLMHPGFIDVSARDRQTELEIRRAEAAERVAEAERQILAFRQQQDRLNLLENQMRLLDLIKEHGLNAKDILGGFTLGMNASMPDVLEAMTRAMTEIIDRAESELGISSPSTKFAYMAKMAKAGWKTEMGRGNEMQMATRSALQFNIPTLAGVTYDDRRSSQSSGGGVTILPGASLLNIPVENLTDLIDVERLAQRVVDVIYRRS